MLPDLSQPLASLPDPLPIPTIPAGVNPFDATIRPPGSKSITNRALLLAALAEGVSTLRGALTDADDARVMIRAIEQLGAQVEPQGAPSASSGYAHTPSPPDPAADQQSLHAPPQTITPATLRITGVGGRWRIAPGQTVRLDLHNAGTATRFLAAGALLAPPGTSVVIDGDERMRERPIGELIEALNSLTNGAKPAEHAGRPGFPPIGIRGLDPGLLQRRATARFGRTQSSQFVSALMLVAPMLPHGMDIEFTDAITSEPYIDMTVGLLRAVGVHVHDRRPAGISIDPSPLPTFDLTIEPDASGATYFHAAAALFPGARVTIPGLDLGPPPRGSLQGDTGFVRVLSALGAQVERVGAGAGGKAVGLRTTGPDRLAPIDIDLSDMPDTAMTAAALCCFAEPTPDNPSATCTLRGLRTLRVKETDRLAALQTELTKLGAKVEIIHDGDDEGLRITPPAHGSARPPAFDTYNDHRMAMSLALIGLRVPGVRINNPGCVAKTYPGFWRDLASLFR